MSYHANYQLLFLLLSPISLYIYNLSIYEAATAVIGSSLWGRDGERGIGGERQVAIGEKCDDGGWERGGGARDDLFFM